jgi:hypothetical protein
MYQLTREDVPDLLLDYKAGKLFYKDGQAYPKIVFTQWKGGKAVPVFSDFGL